MLHVTNKSNNTLLNTYILYIVPIKYYKTAASEWWQYYLKLYKNPYYIVRLISLPCVGLLSQRKCKANATQIVLLILHLDFSFYFGQFGVLFTDYEKHF